MYDFLRSPRWVLSHVLIGLLIVTMVGLGFWQRSRYDEVKSESDRLEAAATGRAVPLEEIVDASTDPDDVGEDVEYRRVQVTGTYAVDQEVLIRNRSQGGAPGAWVLTPLVQDDGTAVGVIRGWIPLGLSEGGPPFGVAAAPGGEVTVTGPVQLTQERGAVGPTDPATGELESLARVDLERWSEQVDEPLEPVWVLLDGQSPAQPEGLPQPVDLDLPSPSTNFSYMVQWWIFALIAAVGYPLVLRRVARNRARGDQVPVDDPGQVVDSGVAR